MDRKWQACTRQVGEVGFRHTKQTWPDYLTVSVFGEVKRTSMFRNRGFAKIDGWQRALRLRNVVNVCQSTAETGADHGFCND